MKPIRAIVAVVVIVGMGVAIVGIGQGDPPTTENGPTGSALTASKQRIASGGEMVQEGKREFSDEGCDDCHSIAATGAKGKLGPRMDTQEDAADEIRTNIVKPRADIAEGYEANLMPTDYAKRMSPKEIDSVVAFIKAASGGKKPGKKEKDGD